MWLLDQNKNLAMSFLPKNGTHSLRDVHPYPQPIDNDKVLSVKTRVGWIRQPYYRLASAYSFFHTMLLRGGGIGDVVADSYEHFIDYTIDNKNPHWMSQIELLTFRGKFLPTICFRFEDINKHWGLYYNGLIPHINGCVHEPITNYRAEEIKEKYLEDHRLWQSLV